MKTMRKRERKLNRQREGNKDIGREKRRERYTDNGRHIQRENESPLERALSNFLDNKMFQQQQRRQRQRRQRQRRRDLKKTFLERRNWTKVIIDRSKLGSYFQTWIDNSSNDNWSNATLLNAIFPTTATHPTTAGQPSGITLISEPRPRVRILLRTKTFVRSEHNIYVGRREELDDILCQYYYFLLTSYSLTCTYVKALK